MLMAMRRLAWSGPKCIEDEGPQGRCDAIERVVGQRVWASLPLAVRERFSTIEPVTYCGEMTTRLSVLGMLFALCLLPFGAPLPVLTGRRPASVHVCSRHGGMSWTRSYRGPMGMEFRVQSIKRLSDDGRLFECCAGGWTMLLDVFADHNDLVFRSRNYFWRFGGVSLPIPLWMTPGVAEIRHRDLGDGHFLFILSFVHPLAGLTVSQEGQFKDPGGDRA